MRQTLNYLSKTNSKQQIVTEKTVLLVEDVDVDTLIVQKILFHAAPHVRCIACQSAGFALQMLHNLETDYFPKIILLDLVLPVMGGKEFLDTYHSKFHLRYPESKVIILTSSMKPGDKQLKAKYPFVAEFWAKPFNIKHAKEISRLV